MAADNWIKAHYLDASALVMLFLDEPGSDAVRDYFYGEANFCTTTLCLAEALGVFKRKWNRSQLTMDGYFSASERLVVSVWGEKPKLDDLGLYQPGIHSEVELMAKQHTLDLSDALQLLTIKRGYFSGLSGPSSSVLITGDAGLETAASAEGIRVWNCKADRKPSWNL